MATSVLEPVEQRLEVDVPDPRDVAAVGDRVVQRDHGEPRRAALDERADRLVRAGRVLDQQHQQRAGRRSRSARSGRTRRRSARARPRRRRARRRARARAPRRRARCRRCRGPGSASAHAPRSLRRRRARTTRARARRARCRARRRRAAAARGRRRDSGSRRGGRRTPRRTRTASRSATQYFESAACWSDGRACRGSSSAEDEPRPAARARARRPAGRRRSRRAPRPPAAPRPRRASARRSARARRSGRAGRGRGCRGRPRAAARAARPRAARASSTSNRPSSAPREASSVEATPDTRFAPDALCASAKARAEDLGRHRRRRRLPVRRGDERGARGQPRGEPVDRARVELPEQLPGHRRPAAAAGQARQAGRRARGEDLGCERNAHALRE